MSPAVLLEPTPATRLSDAEVLIAARSLGASAMGGARLVAALLQPDLEAHELARRIGSEPGIAARVLRVANSAYFGCTGSVATLDRAIQVLGLAGIKGAAAAACMDRMVSPGAAAGCFDADRFRRHSLASACAAQQLARQLDSALAEEAFMAGLLHDLGVVVLAKLRPQGLAAWQRALRGGEVPDDARTDLERQLVGSTHEHCTALTLQAWQLPDSLVQAVAGHHAPAAQALPPLSLVGAAPRPPVSLAALLAGSQALAEQAGLGLDVDSATAPGAAALPAVRLGLDDAAWATLVQRLPDEVAGLMAALAGG
jgi:HD-like signal output (HDOD) protein